MYALVAHSLARNISYISSRIYQDKCYTIAPTIQFIALLADNLFSALFTNLKNILNKKLNIN